jgi:hypothetical protein
MKFIIQFLLVFLVLMAILLFSFFYWGEAHYDPRSKEELEANKKLLSLIKQGNKKIYFKELVQGEWDLACYIPSYSRSGDIIDSYVSAELAHQNNTAYADRFWGISVVNEKNSEVKNFAFRKSFGEPIIFGVQYCIPFSKAFFTTSSNKFIHQWKTIK